MFVANSYISAQVMTFAVPLGTFLVVIFLGFFVRYRPH